MSRPDHKLDRPWGALAAGLYARGRSEARGVLGDRVRTAYDDIHDPDTKGAFTLSLGLMGAEDAIDTLREGAAPGLRRAVGAALRMLGDEFAAQLAARSFGETSSLQTRTSLAASMGMMRQPSNIETLKRATLDGDLDDESRASAARALGHLAAKTAMPWYARLSIDSNVSAPRDTLNSLLPPR